MFWRTKPYFVRGHTKFASELASKDHACIAWCAQRDILGMSNKTKSTSGWWFGTFFIVPYIGNNHPNWLIFFRGVNQPPTRWTLLAQFHRLVHHVFGEKINATGVIGAILWNSLDSHSHQRFYWFLFIKEIVGSDPHGTSCMEKWDDDLKNHCIWSGWSHLKLYEVIVVFEAS